MTAPHFVHLRLHSEFSIVDGTVRIDDGIAAAVADAMPALAVTDLANAFGLVKFYRAARARGIKPIIGCDVWLTHEAERDQPFRALLLAQSRAGYLRLSAWLTRAYRGNQHRGRAELKRDWFAEGTDGLIALSGARDGEVGRRAAAGQRQRRSGGRARVGKPLPGPLLPRSAARRPRRRRRSRRRHRARRQRARAAGGRNAPGAVPPPRGLPRARGARLHRRGSPARRPAAAAALHGGPVLQDAGGDGRRRSATCPRRSRTRSRSRSAAISRSRSARATCPTFRRPPASRSTII